MFFSRFISTDFKVQVKFRTEVLQDRFCDTGYLAEGLFLQRSIFYLDTFQVSLKSEHFSTQVIFKIQTELQAGSIDSVFGNLAFTMRLTINTVFGKNQFIKTIIKK